MDNLTAKQITIVNNLTDPRDRALDLGTKVQQLISSLGAAGTPVNAVKATMTLGVSGVSIDGETVTIGTRKYEFCADVAQSKTLPTNVAVDISVHAAHAARVLTIDTQPTSGDTFTIGTKVYTIVPDGTANADGEVSRGTNLATAKTAIVAAINGTDGHNTPHPLVSASAFATNDCTITALIGGTAGNSVATTETFTAGTNVFAGATLTGGGNCSAANTQADLVAAINGDTSVQVVASNGSNQDVLLTAKVAGAAANNIVLAETMANGAFTGAAVKMAGGVDGTVGVVGQPLVDATYVYFCVADNTVAGQNWRRVSLGSAY
jgi:hypothetical protein